MSTLQQDRLQSTFYTRLRPGRIWYTHLCFTRSLELHDQSPFPAGAEEPYPPSMPNMRHGTALLPPIQYTVRTKHTGSIPRYHRLYYNNHRIRTHPLYLRRRRLALRPLRPIPPQQRHNLPTRLGLAHTVQHIPRRRTRHGHRRRQPGSEMRPRGSMSSRAGNRARSRLRSGRGLQ